MSENLPNDPLVTLLDRLVENNAALVGAVEEIALWIDRQNDPQTLAQIQQHLGAIRANASVVQETLGELADRAALRHEEDNED
ncbi:hypothetical protein ASF84_12150 [Pseudomonas sp. Leaf127]|uniref:hypothetical protein n=1 Tax=Pseudomonas TaxID=286 RepID=UPI000702D03A|nr:MULTISPECIES: hypothetical protein [Pseudomonas]KQQ56047.1 hypothetical protein ASF84_12150 [Pseudomonas sp. Leaf127]